MEPMTGPLRRINRAKEHLDVLNSEIAAFIASRPYRCSIKIDPQDGKYVLFPYLREPFPPAWGLLVGEVAHGLRSALDNIAWAIAIKPTKETVFPIYFEDTSGFKNKLKQLREGFRTDVKAAQPYNAPNGEERSHPLWVLSIVDNIDKHRVIVPGVTRIDIATGLLHPKFLYWDGFTRLNKGDVSIKIIKHPNLKKDFKPEMIAHISFDISTPPTDPLDPPRISLRNLFAIHNFVRNDVYPRFAEFLEPENRSS